MRTKFVLIIFSICFIILGIVFSISLAKLEKPVRLVNSEIEKCSVKTEERIVRGDSLSPLVVSGQTVKILFDYYDCYEIKRNDIVVYNFSGNSNPIIKIVKGLPGDKFHLEKTESGWQILINNEVLKNSENKPYLLSENGYRMLSLYEKDYKGQIPEDAFLILGNIISGSLDSTRFGLVGKDDILGKVELNN